MEERFELFGKHCIKDNNPDASPQLLGAYVACIILNDQDKKIKELEALLKTAREFEPPRIERYAVVKYIHRKNEPYKIVKCYDCYKDKDMKIVYCYYGVESTNFKVIRVLNTKEEAKSVLKQLRENRCNE